VHRKKQTKSLCIAGKGSRETRYVPRNRLSIHLSDSVLHGDQVAAPRLRSTARGVLGKLCPIVSQ
jgi:hypothetical protein